MINQNKPRANANAQPVLMRMASFVCWAISAALGLGLSVRALLRAKYSGADSWSPMVHALAVVHNVGSGLLYRTLFFTGHIKFQYPPGSLMILDLARYIGLNTILQYNLINACILIIYAAVFSLFAVRIMGSCHWRSLQLPLGPVAYILALRFYPNNLAFEIGQLQLLLGLIFLLACFATLCDRQMLAGSLLSIFAITKPQFVPFALLAACRRNWRFVYGFVFLLSGLMVSSVLLYGWRNNLAYLDVLSFLSRHGEWQHLNQSVGGFLNRLFYHGPSLDRDPKGLITQSAFPPYSPFVYYPTLLTTIILTAIPFLIRARSGDKISQLAAFCLAGVAFTMASPIAWVHHYNVLLPAYAVTWKAILDRWDGKVAHITLFLLATSLILVGYPIVPADAWTDPAQNVIQSHVFWGACLLLVLLIAVNLSAPTVHRSTFDIGSDAKTS